MPRPCLRSVLCPSCRCMGSRGFRALPFNPTDKPAVTDHVAFNAGQLGLTNTNWQSYSGEATMSHFTQMTGLGCGRTSSPLSAGMCVLAALIRGLACKRASTLGNFW